jgi:hypothetical protein
MHFDKQTSAKANGRRQLLLVDGHNSHYTRGFLEYARKNHITVLCYPSHSTHLYQGLDVVIFSVLKRSWSKFRDDYKRTTGKTVNKTNFLGVYAKAHLEAFTTENIKAAFRATGVVPFNPNMIPESALAPSRSTSTIAGFPIPPETPVWIMSDMIHHALARQSTKTLTMGSQNLADAEEDRFGPIFTTPIRKAIDDVASSSGRHFFSSSPLKSTSAPPLFKPYTISPFRARNPDLLQFEMVKLCRV